MRTILRSNALGAWALAALLAAGTPAPDAPVADAAMRGDVEAVRALIRQGADVNAAQGDGSTALHWAAELGDLTMVELLVGAKADVGARTRLDDLTALHLAAEQGHGAVVRRLLDAKADARALTSHGESVLHFAARGGSAEAVTALVARGADPNARERVWGQTPLMFAAGWNRPEALRALLQAGADVALTSTVLDVGRRARQDGVAKKARDSVLAHYRAASDDPVTWRPTPAQVQEAMRIARELEELAPAPLARVDWEKAQAEEGKRPNYAEQVGHQGGFTALLHAVRDGHAEAARVLLDAGADIDRPSAGDLTSPLVLAMINGHFDLGMELLERGADPNLASDAGTTPLWAVIHTYWAPKARNPQRQDFQQQRTSYLDAMEALLKAGADPNARLARHLYYIEFTFTQLGFDSWGATPFFRAAHALDIDAMRLLVRYGADPNIPTKAPPGALEFVGSVDFSNAVDPTGLPPVEPGGPGVYPIHVATGFGGHKARNSHRHVPDGWLPAIRYLVDELGVDPGLRDYMGYNALMYAAGRGNNEVIEYLVQKGVDPHVRARSGQNAADMANGPGESTSPIPETLAFLATLGVKESWPCPVCADLLEIR
jgi:ankyrin repeat protein